MLPIANWQMHAATDPGQTGDTIATPAFSTAGWYAATVPGTVLTTLVNNKVYPEPLYGENMRPEIIPESLNKQSFWYRAVLDIPASFAGRHIFLNFDGINYSSAIWVNGTPVGTTRGAFSRGTFDISFNVHPGHKAVIAVLVSPQPHPGLPIEHTLKNGIGKNGGITAIDGPTFLSTIGWDWLPGVRDRDTGIWQKAYLTTTGNVRLKDPLVTTDLPLPRTDSTDIAIKATLQNITDRPQHGTLKGTITDGATSIDFTQPVTLDPNSSKLVSFDPTTTAALHVANPKLWWPNGYGPQNLYKLHLSFIEDARGRNPISDQQDVTFGVRKIAYSVPDSENLTISVNGVRIFIRGGNWGLDEGLKRIPRDRLEAQIRLHALANMNLIRNWVGQSTSSDFYDLCDKYGILLWDEFFQPNPSDGPDPTDLDTYMFNVREKILRFRNHPAIAVWCARNEGFPPKAIDDRLRVLMAELEPTRRYQPSSTSGAGVRSHGPYYWREPRAFYKITDDFFKTETGSMSVPTLESIKGMMPEKDWETITDDWAQHDFARGAQRGDKYPGIVTDRYGKIANLADFTRKAQLMNYEAFRAMYEGRNAQLFHPATAIITWMSHPAQPSFVWQIYHYDLEPNSSLFAVKKAAELLHIQYNEANGNLEVINNTPDALTGATAHLAIYNLDGTIATQQDYPVTAPAAAATILGAVTIPPTASAVHFLKLTLSDSAGKQISDNLYWHAQPDHQDDLTALNDLGPITLDAQVSQTSANGRRTVTVTLHNPGKTIALMTHLQLRHGASTTAATPVTPDSRVLPAFPSDNYISLLPNESRTITIDAAVDAFKGEDALILVDGWNVTVAPTSAAGVSIAPNTAAIPANSLNTGLPFQTTGLRQD